MTDDGYTYEPDAWPPLVAGVATGAIAAIVAALVSLPLRSPDEIIANSLSVVIASLAVGGVAGLLWRRIRATARARTTFAWTMGGGFVVAMIAIVIADRLYLRNLVGYATVLVAIVFITLGFLLPLVAGITASPWWALVPVVIAIALGIGLFGRGNVASGELGLDDLTTTTAATATGTSDTDASTTTTSTVAEVSGALTLPDDLATEYTITGGLATYSVEEVLRGLRTQGVGTTDQITGSIVPGGAFTFTIDLQSFTSDQPNRDGRVRGWFAEHPEGTFSGEAFDLPPSAEVGEVVSFEVSGDLTVNEITAPATWTIEARVEPDGSLSVTGETFIVLTDFAVPIVTSGVVEMEDGATIEVVFSASPS